MRTFELLKPPPYDSQAGDYAPLDKKFDKQGIGPDPVSGHLG